MARRNLYTNDAEQQQQQQQHYQQSSSSSPKSSSSSSTYSFRKSNIPLTCLASIEGFDWNADVTHLILLQEKEEDERKLYTFSTTTTTTTANEGKNKMNSHNTKKNHNDNNNPNEKQHQQQQQQQQQRNEIPHHSFVYRTTPFNNDESNDNNHSKKKNSGTCLSSLQNKDGTVVSDEDKDNDKETNTCSPTSPMTDNNLYHDDPTTRRRTTSLSPPPPINNNNVYFSYSSRSQGYVYMSHEQCRKHNISEQYIYIKTNDPFCFGEPFLQYLVFHHPISAIKPDIIMLNWLFGLSSLVVSSSSSSSFRNSNNNKNNNINRGYIYNPRSGILIDLNSPPYNTNHNNNNIMSSSSNVGTNNIISQEIDNSNNNIKSTNTDIQYTMMIMSGIKDGRMYYWFYQIIHKVGILMKTSFLFFITTTLVSFTLRETQGRMIDFTYQLQNHVRSLRPITSLVTRHVVESLVFVPIMVGMIFFLIELYNGDKFLAFMVLSLVWICESFSVVSLRTKQGMHFFPRIFFLLFALFHFYNFSFPFGFSYAAFITMMCFLIHSMMFFWNRYELLAVARLTTTTTNNNTNNTNNNNHTTNTNLQTSSSSVHLAEQQQSSTVPAPLTTLLWMDDNIDSVLPYNGIIDHNSRVTLTSVTPRRQNRDGTVDDEVDITTPILSNTSFNPIQRMPAIAPVINLAPRPSGTSTFILPSASSASNFSINSSSGPQRFSRPDSSSVLFRPNHDEDFQIIAGPNTRNDTSFTDVRDLNSLVPHADSFAFHLDGEIVIHRTHNVNHHHNNNLQQVAIHHPDQPSSSGTSLPVSAAAAISNVADAPVDIHNNSSNTRNDENYYASEREPSALQSILFPSRDSFYSNDGSGSFCFEATSNP